MQIHLHILILSMQIIYLKHFTQQSCKLKTIQMKMDYTTRVFINQRDQSSTKEASQSLGFKTSGTDG
ncbi:unnamed protein product [Schistosoma curassoni]|uniref:Uncharacterized protein n=1 Tax=Schistosoma curassoni TaxID=6186 RepID=A0A183KX63_9TREM|nr:unnamed protein product [Schistosoma curassoni]